VGGGKRTSDCCIFLWQFPLFFATLEIYPYPPLTQLSTKQAHTVSPVISQPGAMRLNGRRRDTGGKRGGGSHTPVLVKFPLFSTKVKIYAYLPPRSNFSSKKVHRALPVMWQPGPLHLNGRRRATSGGRGSGRQRPWFLIRFHRKNK
jgi:hypothetical protein